MEFVIADIPGLTEGAHEGSGLGHRFLGHVERCQGLLHLIDVTSKDIKKDYLTIIREIEAYDSDLSKKKQILVLTKCDAVEDKKVKSAKEILKKLNIDNAINISYEHNEYNFFDKKEFYGGSITITSLGGIGGSFFTPIINPPEVSILGVGKSFDRLLKIKGKIFSRKIKRAENVVCLGFSLDSAFEFRAKYLNQVLNLPIDIDYISIL